MSADFQAFYGLRLSDVLFVRSPRELLELVEGLIVYDTGLFMAHLAGESQWRDFLGWGANLHMQANLWDLHVGMNTPKGQKAERFPRPTKERKPTMGVPLFSQRPRLNKGD